MNGVLSMNVVWILVIVGLLTFIATRAFGRSRKPDLGSVSHQWVAEHRQSQTQTTNR
jgi:hypothetical protein